MIKIIIYRQIIMKNLSLMKLMEKLLKQVAVLD